MDLSYDEALKMYRVNKDVLLIDVRSPQEFLEGHLNGAINNPLDQIQRNISNVVKNKEQTIILYCQYGTRSKKAQQILKKLGYTKVYNLKNGIGREY